MNHRLTLAACIGALILLVAGAAPGQTVTEPVFTPGWENALPAADRAGRFVAGGEFLLTQFSFSEAVAFARGQQTPTSLMVQQEGLDFDYEPGFRVYGGYQLDNGWGEARLTYTRLEGEVEVDGVVDANSPPGSFIVDPFGAVVGTVFIIDPTNALFGQIPLPTVLGLPVADRIDTFASVDLNYWDLELRHGVPLDTSAWGMEWSMGARLADVDQFYSSTVTVNGAPLAFGDFTVDYFGAGPRTGLTLQRSGVGWGIFASGHGSVLLGTYDVAFSAQPAPGFTAGQSQSMVRMVPITEMEAGARVSPLANLNLSVGWLFQSWFDLGVSGGKFAGFFTGQDDANVMSFDGLFVRGEWLF
jgi:hypothetical protein